MAVTFASYLRSRAGLSLSLLALVAVAAPAEAKSDSAKSEISVYGKLNMSLQHVTEKPNGGSNETLWELRSNASRAGVRGQVTGEESSVSMLYQLEYQVAPDDGSPQLSQRNSFVGIQGSFGKVLAGYYDTPLKAAQLKVDLFNDTSFDIKALLTGEERVSNSVQYQSPKFADGKVQVQVMALLTEQPAAGLTEETSLAIRYDTEPVKLALAQDTRQTVDRTRLTGQFQFGDLQLGVLYQSSAASGPLASPDTSALVMSLSYQFANSKVYGQLVDSDQLAVAGSFTGFGYENKIDKNTKWFAFYGSMEGGKVAAENTVLAAGLEFRF